MRNKILVFLGLLTIMCSVVAIGYYQLWDQSIRLDESQSIIQAIKPMSALIPFEAQDVQTPLYVVIEHFWIQIFGTAIIYSRILSLIFLLASIPILYKVYAEASNRKIAILSVAFFAFSPFIIWYSSEARTYTLFTLIAAINHLYFLRLMRSNGQKGQFGYWISTLLGYYTHYFYIFFVISQCIYVLWRLAVRVIRSDYKREGIFSRIWQSREPALTFFKLLIFATILFIPWLVYVVILGTAANTQPLITQPTSYDIFLAFSNFIFGFQSNGIESLLVSLWPLVVVAFFFVFTRRTRQPVANLFYFIFVTFFPVIFVFLISYFKPILLSRYLIFITPTLFFIIAWTLLSYPKRMASFLVVLFSAIMLSLLFYQNLSNNTPVKEDYRGVDNYLNTHVQPTDIIAVTAPFTVYPVEYGYDGNARIDTIPYWDVYSEGGIPAFSIPNLQTQMKGYAQQYENIYVVLSYDQGYEQKIILYMDTHYQRERLINFTPGLQLREYKLRYDKK